MFGGGKRDYSDTYERLIPDIFMRLYPTFTLAEEVVSRLIQRFLAFAPIEPGGLGRVGEGADLDDPNVVWGEALNALQFLVKLLSRSKRISVNSKLGIKILRLGELLKLDARTFTNQSDVPHTPGLDAGSGSSSQEGSPTKPPHESAISKELDHISDCLLELVPKIYSDQSDLAEAVIRPLASVTVENGMNPQTCTCLQKLEKFRRFNIRELAEQITIIEEMFFDSIQLSELIKIKDLERGNTPTLSRCVQNFNDLNSMVTCLTLIAKELGQPLTRDQHEAGKAGSGQRRDPDDPRCHLCGLPREASAPQGLPTACRSSVAGEPVVMRRNSLKVYLCMASSSAYLSMRAKRNNFLLESTLWRLCDLAEELKKMNNFSSFLAVILGLQNAPTHHVSKKLKLKLNDFGAYMLPPSFIAYRRDLENARMPCLPYLGLVFQQLIHLDSGNPLFLPSVADTEGEAVPANCSGLITEDEADADKVVNFWRCWKHYLILGYFMKRADTDMLEEGERRSYGFKPNAEIQGFLNSFNSPTMKLLPRQHDPVGGAKVMPSRSQRTKSVNLPLNS
ncbi:unnamed protein product [Mesocestoides corti]|uniref:Ras-GEF domain-containing protein n=2 Tax=Mesocestoides corti TaxID=53468 RepID=A0A0R3UAF7_MESCO|nr:unnamed protein product [Mesocestoides corti]